MNYYEHHIGDYDKNTSHLTACEDGIYSRMIRRYMDKERPLDVDTKEIKRIVRARNREEKSAVDAILKEFFHFENDGWHHKTCDETIAAYQAGEPEREVKKANEDNRMKRHREERARLFKAITDAGQHAPWNIGMNELRELVKRLPETLLPPLPATAPATPATATQSPIPNTHTPELTNIEASPQASSSVGDDLPKVVPPPGAPPAAPSRNVAISILLRGYGINATSQNPLVCLDWAENPNVTDEIITLAAVKARTALPDQPRINVNYLKPIVADLLNPPEAKPSKSDDWEWTKSDGGIQRKANELGIRAHGNMSFRDLADKCKSEIQKRKGTRS